MKYQYTSCFPPSQNLRWIKRPIIEIEVFGPNDNKKFNAIVDSGADISLFNIQIAELLGLDLSKAEQRSFSGISGTTIAHCLDNVEIKVQGMDELIKIPIGFIDSETVGLLLGEEGFFDQYRIKFEKDHNVFEIIPTNK